MAFWKNLTYVFSDEFSSWLHFLVKSYNQRTEKSEKNLNEISSQMQRVIDSQSTLENHIKESGQEQKECREDIAKVTSQCEAILSECEAISAQVNQPKEEPEITRQYLEQLIGEALAKQSAESAQRSQILSARIREVYAYIESLNEKDPDEPDVNELLGRIEMLEQENEEYKDQLIALQKELDEVKDAHLAAERSYKDEKRRTFDLSKRLVQADDKIKDLIVRVKDKDLENMLVGDEVDNPFMIVANKEKYMATAGNIQVMVTRFANTAILDNFFEEVPEYDSYKKMYLRYQKNIRSAAGHLPAGADIGEILHAFISVVQEDLIDKLMQAIYRRMKTANAEYEGKLLEVVNQYLEAVGFYCRDDIREGEFVKEIDLQDMECVQDDRTAGKQHGEIVEIALYPYYINYLDRGGRRRKAHTQGVMTVIA